MKSTAKEIINRIRLAFERRELVDKEDVFMSYTYEGDIAAFKKLAYYDSWQDLPQKVLQANPEAPMFMTTPAFAWFLPAYLTISIVDYSRNGSLASGMITCLTPPDEVDASIYDALIDDLRKVDPALVGESDSSVFRENDDQLQRFEDFVNLLNLEEKIAIRDYLLYIDANYSADYPVFGPKLALERYWSIVAF